MFVIGKDQREQLSAKLRAIFYAIPHTHIHLQDEVAEVRAELQRLPKLKERNIDIKSVRILGMDATQLQELVDWATERGWHQHAATYLQGDDVYVGFKVACNECNEIANRKNQESGF
jgi:hypothetical protein